jgi:hypothetical protein
MRFLMSALIAEGSSDDRFLPFLLRRCLEDVCAADFSEMVDVERVTVLRERMRPLAVPDIIDLVRRHENTFHLVFVHRDQARCSRPPGRRRAPTRSQDADP